MNGRVFNHLTRRELIAGLAALAGTQLIPSGEALGQSGAPATATGSRLGIIDVHHHFMPPKYVEAHRTDILNVSITPAVLEWTPARSLEDMDKNGVRTAIISVSAPGIWFDAIEEARTMARECNEYAARLVADHPGRFGFFAAVPLPDKEG